MAKPVSESKAQTSTVKVPWAGRRGYFDLLLGASCVILIISNIGATKGVEFGPLPFELPLIGNTIVTDGGFFLSLSPTLLATFFLRCTASSVPAARLWPPSPQPLLLPCASC